MSTSTDKFGFPMRPCRRCDGTDPQCPACRGTGDAYVTTEFYAWRDAVRKAVRVTTMHLQVGDRVVPWGVKPKPRARVVADVAAAPYSRLVVTFSDGTTETHSATSVWHRAATVDPAEYIARAVAALE